MANPAPGAWWVRALRDRLVWTLVAFALLLLYLPHSGPAFLWLFPGLERPVYAQEPFAELLWQHCRLVGLSSMVSVGVGSFIGIFLTRPAGQPFESVLQTLVAAGQTCPPVAVLALAVPLVGFGELPALIALALYGLLPVVQSTVVGLRSLPQAVVQSARGLGMSGWQCLTQVELPLALPVWLAGVRSSVVINIGTAAIASTVGAKTLGSPIIVGLSGFNSAYVLQGALLVGMLAVWVDMVFERLSRRVSPLCAKVEG